MAWQDLIDLIDRQRWLDPVGDGLQRAVGGVFAAAGPAQGALKNLVHGVWLGHPLHPALTDVPIGAWTAALALDGLAAVSGQEEVGRAADAAIVVGLSGAAGAAVTGLSDWQYTSGRARRVGVAHGLLNVGGVLLYASSLLLRRRGARAAGHGLAALGYAVATASAYLGGELVFGQRIGVDRAADATPSDEFVAVLPAAELPEGQLRRVEAGAVPVLLVRQGDRIQALADTCSHLGCPLSEGHLRDSSVICPCHGSRFALADGRVLDGPATFPQPCFETRVRDGQIEVRAVSR